MTVEEAAQNSCSTSSVKGLTKQIIDEMNVLVPNVLVKFDELDVVLAGSAINPFLQPLAKESLKKAIAEMDAKLQVASAYRTISQQFLLFTWFKQGRCGIPLAASPGKSNHENGLALDIPHRSPNFPNWRKKLVKFGWVWFGNADKPHFTFNAPAGIRHDLAKIGVKAFQQLWNIHNPGDLIGVDGDYGPETEKRLKKSPAGGFQTQRLLIARTPPLQGDDVLRLQKALRVSETGQYDAATVAAVRAFQESKGLKVDGIAGPMTFIELGLL